MIQTYFVQVILGDDFEDLYIKATSRADAIAKAKQVTTIKHRFATFYC